MGSYEKPSISFVMLLDFSVQRTYHDIMILSEILPRKIDFERKKEIIMFSDKTRKHLIRLLGIIRWIKHQINFDKCDKIISFLDNQNSIFIDTADFLANLSRNTLTQARLPKYLMREATNVIVNGTYPFLPLCIKKRVLNKTHLSQTEKQLLFNRLHISIHCRLLLEGLPPLMKIKYIASGKVCLYVEHEFNIILTLNLNSEDPLVYENLINTNYIIIQDLCANWRLLRLDILIMQNKGSDFHIKDKQSIKSADIITNDAIINDAQIKFLQNYLQIKLITKSTKEKLSPLWQLYDFLHSFCQGLILESIYSQLTKLFFQKFDGINLKILKYKPNCELCFSYWNHDVNTIFGQELHSARKYGQISKETTKSLSQYSERFMKFYKIKISKSQTDLYETFNFIEKNSLKISHYPEALINLVAKSLEERIKAGKRNINFNNPENHSLNFYKWLTKHGFIFDNLDEKGNDYSKCRLLSSLELPRCFLREKYKKCDEYSARELEPGYDIELLIERIIKIRVLHKLIILQGILNIILRFNDDKSHIKIMNIRDFDENNFNKQYPYLQVSLDYAHDASEKIIFFNNKSNGMFKINVSKYPDVNGHLFPLLEKYFNIAFEKYIHDYLFDYQNTTLDELKSEELTNIGPSQNKDGTYSHFLELIRITRLIYSTLKIYILSSKLIKSVYHLSSYINIRFNHFNHNNNPITVAYSHFINNIIKHNRIPLSKMETNTNVQKDNGDIILLIISLSKFKAYHIVVTYNVNSQYNNIFFCLACAKLTVNNRPNMDKENILLPINTTIFSDNQTKNCSLIDSFSQRIDYLKKENPCLIFNRLITKFESLLPISEIACALLNTQPKISQKYSRDDHKSVYIKQSEIVKIGNFDRKDAQDLSFEYGLLLHFEVLSYLKKTYQKPFMLRDTNNDICFYSSFMTNKALFTLQGKTSRYWFVTLYLDNENGIYNETRDSDHVRKKVYLQYFSLPFTKYQEVADFFFRDIRCIMNLGSSGQLFISRKLEPNNISLSIFKKLLTYITLAYGPNKDYYVKIQFQETTDHSLKLTFTRSTYFNIDTNIQPKINNINPHNFIKDFLEYEFNRSKSSQTHETIFWLLNLLNMTLEPLNLLVNLDELPILGSFNKSSEKTYVASHFSHLITYITSSSIFRYKIIYRKIFCIRFFISITNPRITVVQDISKLGSNSSEISYFPLIYFKEFLYSHMARLNLKPDDESVMYANKRDKERYIKDNMDNTFINSNDDKTISSRTHETSNEFDEEHSFETHMSISTYDYIFKDAYWLNEEVLLSVLRKTGKPPQNSSMEKYLECVFIFKCLIEVLQNDENINLIYPASYIKFVREYDLHKDWLKFQGKNNGLQCQICIDAHSDYQKLKISFINISSLMSSIIDADYQILEKFLHVKIFDRDFRYNSLVSYCRILGAPINVLKDCIDIMRLEFLIGTNNSFKWNLEWCLTIPPIGPILAPIGSPAVIIKNKMLFLLELKKSQYTSNNVSSNIQPHSLVVPIVYDINNNITQLADPTKSSSALPNSPVISAINIVLKRFAEYHYQNFPNRCSLYPSVKELITNLTIST
ncbi:uncharacterized protein LOC135925664 isoform X3 [Gordionus sp. m RMFG-2023]|uniref:uncharacterized protein LOC135925664 isoform X3 n=1 Tax=Gordionus sp. m RMFG-2023 TaxID=3053472 RepID=UPI0031FDE155